MKWSARLWVVTCALCATPMAGCLERPGTPIGPNVGYGQSVTVGHFGVGAVDVLLVIDDSGSMSEEQTNLAVEIPALVRDLASPPDRDGDGVPDWNAAERLRIAITTTDVGIGSTTVDGSHCVIGGDDGALRGGVFEWNAGDDPDAFAGRVRETVETLGITGCAFEQPLEAAARAVAQRDATGFPADDGLFAVIVVTDEEDCSVEDDDGFFASMTPDVYNVYCPQQSHALTSVDELVAQLRGDRPEERFVFAAIAGVPRGLAAGVTPAEILAHPEMAYEVIETTHGLRLRPVCEFVAPDGTSLGKADPARRLVEVAARVPGSVLTTICTDDFGPAVEQIGARIGSQIPGVCLVRELPADADGAVPCEATVRMPADDACDGWPGYAFLETDADGRQLCSVAQVSSEEPSGFYYDAANEACPQLALTEDARPPLGAELSVECFFPLQKELGEQCARHSQCASGWCDPTVDACATLPETPGDPDPVGG